MVYNSVGEYFFNRNIVQNLLINHGLDMSCFLEGEGVVNIKVKKIS